MIEILLGVNGVLLTVVGFFLIRTMSKLDVTHDMAQANKMDIALLRERHTLEINHIDDKLEDMKEALSEIKIGIKKINNE